MTRSGRRRRALADGLAERAAAAASSSRTAAVGGMFGFFFHPGPVAQLRGRQEVERDALPPLLRRDARARRLPGTLGVRGGLRLPRARPARARRDAAGGRGCVRGGRASIERAGPPGYRRAPLGPGGGAERESTNRARKVRAGSAATAPRPIRRRSKRSSRFRSPAGSATGRTRASEPSRPCY